MLFPRNITIDPWGTGKALHTKISTVDDISPSINNATLAINYRLVEIETI